MHIGWTMADLFPMFVKLSGRKCLVVGGGQTAEFKIEGLLQCEAEVHVVAPAVTGGIRSFHDKGWAKWSARDFRASDLEGVHLVIAATGSRRTNMAVFKEAESRRVLCNTVDEPERCHFYYPAVVRRGALQVAISTAGLSPALAKSLRQELEAYIVPEYDEWLRRIGAIRQRLLGRPMDAARRTRMLKRLGERRPSRDLLSPREQESE